LHLIGEDIDIGHDLEILEENDYLYSIGPYYYIPTNTRFYFTKLNIIENESLSSIDFGVLFNLHRVPVMEKSLEKYFKQRKSLKKSPRSIEDIIKDIGMCIEALEHIEKASRHAHYLDLFINSRNSIVECENLAPAEPDEMPEKPQPPQEPVLVFNSILSLGISRSRQRSYQKSCQDYGHKIKVYYIRSREFEKACERYKTALKEWEEYHDGFLELCFDDIYDAENKLNHINNLLNIYNSILQKSFIHPDYHQPKILRKFKYYLETGRAQDIQDCMNLYEEEKYWEEIKASQERIENTIHFLQTESDLNPAALEKTRNLIASTTEV
jgi:hypothetical protein